MWLPASLLAGPVSVARSEIAARHSSLPGLCTRTEVDEEGTDADVGQDVTQDEETEEEQRAEEQECESTHVQGRSVPLLSGESGTSHTAQPACFAMRGSPVNSASKQHSLEVDSR